MQSFRHSRRKTLFEILCAFAVSASCVGAWIQTSAWALLSVSFVAAIYGLVHAFELKTVRSAATVDSQDAALAVCSQDDLLSDEDAGFPVMTTDRQSMAEASIEEADPVEPSKSDPTTQVARAKTRGKGRGRRAKGAKETKAAELAPQDENEVEGHKAAAENTQLPLVPLFEPQPYMRQQRAVFGRKDNFA